MPDVAVYDKAKWHFEGDYPADLDHAHAYIHGGYFFGWIVENDLADADFLENFEEEVQRFRSGDISPRDLYEVVDGRLVGDMLNHDGNAFTSEYFDRYLDEYESILGVEPNGMYCVVDTSENYGRVCAWLSAHFHQWKASN